MPECSCGKYVHSGEVLCADCTTALRARIATLEAQVEQAMEALEEIIYVPGEDGPIPKSCADEMCQIAEAALQALGEGGDHAD
jgi:uncharacterized Zn finger protein (UPF0148 family)